MSAGANGVARAFRAALAKARRFDGIVGAAGGPTAAFGGTRYLAAANASKKREGRAKSPEKNGVSARYGKTGACPALLHGAQNR
jgi:hypothetical protein